MNPFDTLEKQLTELKGLVVQILEKPKEDLSQKKYTVKEAATLLNVDSQTIRNHIEKGNIRANFLGRRILISHEELFSSLNEVKSLKYKRQT